MHQTVARYPAVSSFERGIIIRAKLHFKLLQLVGAASLFLYFAYHRLKRTQSGLARMLRLVENFRHHLRRPVVTEQIVNSAVGFHRDLLLEHQLAIDAARASA